MNFTCKRQSYGTTAWVADGFGHDVLQREGVEEDTAQAAYWFGCAAESNDATAQYSLACLYFNGEGIERNIAKACALLEAAICNGHPHKDALIPLLNQWREMMSSLERPSENNSMKVMNGRFENPRCRLKILSDGILGFDGGEDC